MPPPPSHAPHRSGTFATTGGPTLHDTITQSPCLTLEFTVGVVQPVSLNMYITTHTPPYSTTDSPWIALKSSTS